MNYVASAFKHLGANISTSQSKGPHPVQTGGGQQPVKFCMFTEIYARELVEMIHTSVAGPPSSQLDMNNQSINQDLVKYKNYYIDLLLKQSDVYQDILS